MPYYSVCLALINPQGKTVFSAVEIPETNQTFLATESKGISLNERSLAVSEIQKLEKGTVSFVIGHNVTDNEEYLEIAKQMESNVQRTCKRVLKNWCPSIDWCLASKGDIEAIVCYKPDREEIYAGRYMAKVSDCAISEENEYLVASQSSEITDRLTNRINKLL